MTEIAKILWQPAYALSQEGIPYHNYLTELTWLWLLKIAPAYGVTTTQFNWDVLISQTGKHQYTYYKKALTALQQVPDPHLAGIFKHAHTALKSPQQLAQVIATLAILDKVPRDEMGEIYEELLAQGAHQGSRHLLVAPRPLIDLMIIVTQPQPDELIHDPFAGVANFLVAADQYVQVISEEWTASDDTANAEEQQLLIGIEPDLIRQRLALMNCLLHHLDYFPGLPVQWNNSLLLTNQLPLPAADVIFSLLIFTHDPSDELTTPEALLQYILQSLKPGGRAAVIVPDYVCTATGPIQQLRKTLLDTCVVHTILRLPTGIFHPHQILAHVLFFKRSETALETTKKIWFYDARSHFPTLGATLPITREHLLAFEMDYGDDPFGQSPRPTEDQSGRWRCVSRQTLAQQNDQLSFSWLTEKSKYNPPSPEKLWKFFHTTRQELTELTALLR